MEHHAAKVAQQWWEDLPPKRQIEIYKWVSGLKHHGHPEVEGQLDLLEGEF